MSHDGPASSEVIFSSEDDPLGIGEPEPLFGGSALLFNPSYSYEPEPLIHPLNIEQFFSLEIIHSPEEVNPMPAITLTNDDIKLAIRNFEKSKEEFYLKEGVTETIEAANYLDMQYLNYFLRRLVGDYKHLRESVGIIPVFNNESNEVRGIYDVVHGLVCQKLAQDENYQHLWPIADTTEERNKREEGLKAAATKYLTERNVTQKNMLPLYLAAMVEDAVLMGNNHKKELGLNDCQQLLFPIRINNNHFTVCVIRLMNGPSKSAQIKFYDSMGRDIDATTRGHINEFLRALGYEDRIYENVSQYDQNRETYNCGLFACFKGIDIANENVGQPERLLPQLNGANYHGFFNRARYFFAKALQEGGYAVQVDANLQHQVDGKTTVSADEQAAIIEMMQDILKQLSRKKSGPTSQVKTTPDEEKTPQALKSEFDQYAADLRKYLEQKLALRRPTKKDQNQIILLIELLEGLQQIELRKKIEEAVTAAGGPAPAQGQPGAPGGQPQAEEGFNLFSFMKAMVKLAKDLAKEGKQAVLANLSWKKAALYGLIGLPVIILGGPWLYSVMAYEIAPLLPTNGWLTIGLASLFFVGGLSGMQYLYDRFIAKKPAAPASAVPAPAQPGFGAQPQPATKTPEELAKEKEAADKQKQADEAKAQEEAKKKQDEDAKAKAEAEAKQKQDEEAKAKVEAEAKRKQEEDDKAKAEAEAKQKQDEEAKASAEVEAKRKQEEEAKAKTDGEGERKQEEDARAKAGADVTKPAGSPPVLVAFEKEKAKDAVKQNGTAPHVNGTGPVANGHKQPKAPRMTAEKRALEEAKRFKA